MIFYQTLYYGTWLLVLATLFYEAAARTNLRSLMKLGIPIYRQKIELLDPPDLPDHIEGLTQRLNPQTAVSTGLTMLQKALMQPTSKKGFIVLPTSQHEAEFRNGTLCRGRISLASEKRSLIITGFYTWPSLIVPLVIYLISAFIPFGFFLIYLLIFANIYGQRKQYQLVSYVVNAEFSDFQAEELI